MRHIIEASSKPGDMVLDTFVGNGGRRLSPAGIWDASVWTAKWEKMSLRERWRDWRNKNFCCRATK
ncbi:MAG TPA: hypothetical protein VIF37_04425 [Methylobacter sp.]